MEIWFHGVFPMFWTLSPLLVIFFDWDMSGYIRHLTRIWTSQWLPCKNHVFFVRRYTAKSKKTEAAKLPIFNSYVTMLNYWRVGEKWWEIPFFPAILEVQTTESKSNSPIPWSFGQSSFWIENIEFLWWKPSAVHFTFAFHPMIHLRSSSCTVACRWVSMPPGSPNSSSSGDVPRRSEGITSLYTSMYVSDCVCVFIYLHMCTYITVNSYMYVYNCIYMYTNSVYLRLYVFSIWLDWGVEHALVGFYLGSESKMISWVDWELWMEIWIGLTGGFVSPEMRVDGVEMLYIYGYAHLHVISRN